MTSCPFIWLFSNPDILLVLGIALFLGTLGGKIIEKLKIPKVVAYLLIGLFLGNSFLGIVSSDTIKNMQHFNSFALGIVGFMIGGELKKDVLLKYGRQFLIILMIKSMITFLSVSLVFGFIGSLFMPAPLSWSIALLLGAIASATAPAATTSVIWECKSKGPLTRTILGLVALDDGLALILFAFARTITGLLLGNIDRLSSLIVRPIIEIGGAIVLGLIVGILTEVTVRRMNDEKMKLAFLLAFIVFTIGMALSLNFDMILATMFVGIVLVNAKSHKSSDDFRMIENFFPPIQILFFVLVGAKISLEYLTTMILILSLVFMLSRIFGKMIGSFLGAIFARAPKTVRRNLPFCLLSQAGVAIGLSIIASQRFGGELAHIIVMIVAVVTLIFELIGPPLVKYGVSKAGEIGLNITEEDLIKMSKVIDVMDSSIPYLSEKATLSQVVETFADNDNLNFPVVDDDERLIGVLTVNRIKDSFIAAELSDVLLAHDLMEPPLITAKPDDMLTDIREIMKQEKVDFVPVIDSNNKSLGILENRLIDLHISHKILEYQKVVEDLDNCP